MSTQYVCPTPASASSLLEMLIGESVAVTEGNDLDVSASHVATFVSDDGEVVAICACDTRFVIYSGSAIAMLPAAVAEEALAAGEVPDNISDNFYEVMNICSKLLMSDHSAHLRLAETLRPDASNDALAAMDGNGTTAAFTLDIPGYGSGALTFIIS